MRYASLDTFELCNGNGVGVSLFVQGCQLHCDGCFNKETWDFEGGREWSGSVEKRLEELLSRDYVTRFSVLGGEPLAHQNINDVYRLISKVKRLFPNLEVWVYTGLECERLLENGILQLMPNVDVLVDGPYKKELSDKTLAFRGSRNQRIIDVKQTISSGRVVLWEK